MDIIPTDFTGQIRFNRNRCRDFGKTRHLRYPLNQMVPVTTSVAMPGVAVYAPVTGSWV